MTRGEIMRIIALNGAKNTRKEWVARKLESNSDCIWIHPWTDKPSPWRDYEDDEMMHIDYANLDYKIEHDNPIAITEINNYRYVWFEYQLIAGYCILIADDNVIKYLKENWTDELITVKIHSNDEIYSARSQLKDDEFDIVFNVDNDDIEELEELVGDIYHFIEGEL